MYYELHTPGRRSREVRNDLITRLMLTAGTLTTVLVIIATVYAFLTVMGE
jgi:hypothetical protein